MSTIRSILALQHGGIAYSALNGDMNILDASGKEVFVQIPDLDHYSQKTFLISPDATVVMYGYKNRAGVTEKFSVETKRLESNPVSTFGMSPPITRSEVIRISDIQPKAIPKLNGKPLTLIERQDTTCYAIAPDHQSVIVGTRWYLYRFDRNGKKIWHRVIPGAPRAVNISADGRLAVAGLSDGTIRWYRMKDGRELLAFLPRGDGKRWVLWTPSGYYDASEGGDELIGWHVNNGLDREATLLSRLPVLRAVLPPRGHGPGRQERRARRGGRCRAGREGRAESRGRDQAAAPGGHPVAPAGQAVRQRRAGGEDRCRGHGRRHRRSAALPERESPSQAGGQAGEKGRRDPGVSLPGRASRRAQPAPGPGLEQGPHREQPDGNHRDPARGRARERPAPGRSSGSTATRTMP